MLKNLKLAPKLFGAFAIVLLLMAGLGLFALLEVPKVNDSASEIASNWMLAAAETGTGVDESHFAHD